MTLMFQLYQISKILMDALLYKPCSINIHFNFIIICLLQSTTGHMLRHNTRSSPVVILLPPATFFYTQLLCVKECESERWRLIEISLHLCDSICRLLQLQCLSSYISCAVLKLHNKHSSSTIIKIFLLFIVYS